MSAGVDPDDDRFEQQMTPQTGIPALDELIASVAALDDNDVDGHVATFEAAHVELRQALDQPRGAS